jgi:hypothetical protein
MSPEEAQRAARIELGGIEQVKEQVRDVRTGAFLNPCCKTCDWHFARSPHCGTRRLRGDHPGAGDRNDLGNLSVWSMR